METSQNPGREYVWSADRKSSAVSAGNAVRRFRGVRADT